MSIMKQLYLIPILCATLLLSGCSKEYDDSALNGRLDGLEERVEALEELCRQMNTNISSLQTIVTALQDNDYITNVSPVTSGGKTVGYTITFAKNGVITIYHGEDGKDAVAPKLGVLQDTDGIYYWTLDGEWLTDDHGNKIKAQGGSDQESIPRLKIENGYWYVSYGESGSWQQLGKATGEDGDSMFEKVEQDDEYVYITLAGETEAIAIPKKITLRIEFTEGRELQFAENETKRIHYSVTGENTDRIVVKAEMLNQDGAYTLRTEPSSASSGTIIVTVTNPTINQIIVTVSDGNHTIMEAIDVSHVLSIYTVEVTQSGTLNNLLNPYQNIITSLTVIGNLNDDDIKAINDLPYLAVLDISEANIDQLPDQAFYEKKSLSSIVLPKTLKKIGNNTFGWCSNLTGDLVIPEGVTTIGANAFDYCSGFNGNLVIPQSVVTIGSAAFQCCHFKGDLIIPNKITEIQSFTFAACWGFTGLVIPKGVKTIGASAFYANYYLTGNLMIPDGVTTIGESAFAFCRGFTGELVIPKSVTTIGDYAFNGCSGFTENLVISENVTNIGKMAFSGCNFKNVYCKTTVPPQSGANAFSNLLETTLYVPVGSKDAYLSTEGWKDFKFKEIVEMQF